VKQIERYQERSSQLEAEWTRKHMLVHLEKDGLFSFLFTFKMEKSDSITQYKSQGE
jgi:hypothetical protein